MLIYSLTEGKFFKFSTISERRVLVLKADKPFVRNPDDPSLAGEALHPYTGFISEPAASAMMAVQPDAVAVMGGSVAEQFARRAVFRSCVWPDRVTSSRNS